MFTMRTSSEAKLDGTVKKTAEVLFDNVPVALVVKDGDKPILVEAVPTPKPVGPTPVPAPVGEEAVALKKK